MRKRIISFTLVLVMVLGLMATGTLTAAAASDTDMDALTALGIDTGNAPDGYDAFSTDNPFGRNTVALSPVYELYKIGLSTGVGSAASYTTTSTIQNGGTTQAHATTSGNTLNASLYGNEKWAETTVSGILGSGSTAAVASGTTTADGSYTLASSGAVTNTEATNIPATGYLKDAVNASTDLGAGFKYALSTVAAGNFDNNTSGLAAQTAMVYTSDYSKNGGLYLRFGNAKTGTYGAGAKELLSTAKVIGNPDLKYDEKPVENFAEAPYQLQNYLQVTTGDWNGDGIDEVAVYIPESGNSRIVVFALQLTGADNRQTAYLDASKWSVVWSYYLREGDVVSNMVSLVSGDVNEDGTDDLAATWGYYYGPTQNIGSTAVVMFGAKGTAMLNQSQQFNLTYGSSNIVRASFDFGDMAGSNQDVLILCGQSDADLKSGKTQTRYVALYSWNGTAFTSNVYQNFDLFEKKDGACIWTAMSAHNDKFYSLPLCTANTGVISQGVTGGGDLLYFDSLIIKYTDKGLSIKEAWDNTAAMQQNTGSPIEYVEYGAVAGDLTGQTGAGALVTMTQTLSSTAQQTTTYTVTGSHLEPNYSWNYYYQNWLYRLFGIKSWYLYISGYTTVADTSPVTVGYEQLTMGKTHVVAADPVTNYLSRTQADFSTAVCLANTDNDSSYMNYSGRHYFTYTDPEVLAVLASPPYFNDLIGRDDLSGGYAESATSYSSTSGSGSGYGVSATISLGAYVSFEQDFEVFGVKVASVEAEASITANFTYETEKTSTLEQTVTYTATSGEDMVAFYSIPLEIYEYASYVADGSGGYKEVLSTVNIPHEAAIRLLSLDEYESIARDYSVLPAIADNVLTHTLGDPSTYPVGTDGYNVIAKYNGTPTAVGFSSTGGGSGISQEIAMSRETTTSFSASVAVEAKAGAGPGGVKVGVIAGAEAGAGAISISTNGNSFSGELQNMPIEAQPFGYGMNWKIFCYKYSDGRTSFPVVSYIVSDVHAPAALPDNFEQDIAATTWAAATLRWSYDKTVAGFRIYRYFEFPDGSGSYEIAFVPFAAATDFDSATGIYSFSYTDDDLSPYTEYKYQIQTVSSSDPRNSIYSEPLVCRTKTKVGYPTITINGLNDSGQLPIFPDANSTMTVSLASAASYSGLSYQWQKLIDGTWTELSGKTTSALTISNAGSADNAYYRCRVNCIYYDSSTASNYYISAYSAPVTTVYAKRIPTASVFTAAENTSVDDGGATLKGLTASIELHSATSGHPTAPAGNATFTIKGTDYLYSQTLALAVSAGTKPLGGSEKYYATASLSIPSLPDGVYTLTAYYSGNRIFRDMETTAGVLVVVGNGSAHSMTLAASDGGSAVTKFNYSNAIWPTLQSISKDTNAVIVSSPVGSATFKLFRAGTEVTPALLAATPNFVPGTGTPDIGSYTMQAYVGGVLTAEQDFTVGKKDITVTVENRTNISTAAVEANPPVITCAELTADALAALHLTYSATNSAGNPAVLNNSTDPGKYTVTACTGADTPVLLYNNYNVSYVSGSYIIIGATYRLTAVAAPFTDPFGTRPVGTVGISNAAQTFADYSSGTAVLLYAVPMAGYQVDTWTALYANSSTRSQTGGTTFTLTTEAQAVTVTVTFKPATIRLSTVAQPTAGGSIACTDEYFSSGAYVSYGAEYAFNAIPQAGYHFDTWQITSGGMTSELPGTPGANGSNSLTVTVGSASTTVFAVFERDAYTLALSGDIKAYYLFDDDGDSSTDPIQKPVLSGGSLTGDTLVTVLPKTGYQADQDAFFIVNGTPTNDSVSHAFNITENTTVSLVTVQNSYSVEVSASNGSVTATVGGIATPLDALSSVPGGSSLSFTAHADRGYVFDHWILDGAAQPGSNSTLTIAALGSTTQIEAVFEANDAYTATASVSAPTRGTMLYTLRDTYGALVGLANTEMPAGGLTVYRGESIVLSVNVVTGSMMEQWRVNGVNTYTTQKTYTINNISGNIDAVAYIKAASSYAVYFLPIGTTGSTLTATVDGTPFTTGTLQFAGSALEFRSTPAGGFMLDYWTVTSGNLTVAEAAVATNPDGHTVLDPIYTINPLRQNLTVRAHYTALVVHNVTLPADTSMGDCAITYVTPLLSTDNGTRNSLSESVRDNGTVVMTFIPKDGYSTSIAHLKAALDTAVNTPVNTGTVVSVVKNGNVYTAKILNLKQAFSLDADQIFDQAYSITVPAGVSASSNNAIAGETVTLTVTPDNGDTLSALTLDTGTLIETVAPSLLTYSFVMPASDVIVTAVFTFSGGGDGGGGGGGGGGGEDATGVPVPASAGGTSLDISTTVDLGVAQLEMNDETLEQIGSMTGTLTIDLTSLDNITSAIIPADAFLAIAGSSGITSMSIGLTNAEVTFDAAAIAVIGASGTGSVTLTATMLDVTTLSPEQQALIGDKPVLDLTLTAGGNTVSDFGSGSVAVKVPYTLGPGEDPNSVVVWYLNDKGILESVTGRYDADTQCVDFTTDHFSKYVIGTMPFNDVSRDMWYFNDVSFAFANGLFSGIEKDIFAPDTSMTRAMLIIVLWRMEGEPTAGTNTFTDVKDGEWYTKAVVWAAASNIVSGDGGGLFRPLDVITREQMALILRNYAVYKDYTVTSTGDLSIFSDIGSISSWAKTAMQWAYAEGLITGTDRGMLDPNGTATRSQVAAILQRFITNVAE